VLTLLACGTSPGSGKQTSNIHETLARGDTRHPADPSHLRISPRSPTSSVHVSLRVVSSFFTFRNTHPKARSAHHSCHKHHLRHQNIITVIMSSAQHSSDARKEFYAELDSDAKDLRAINMLTNLWNAMGTNAVVSNKQEPNIELKTPDVGNALLSIVFNLFCGIISAVHGIFMQWAILFLVGNIVLIDFNDLLREDLEKLLDGEMPELASPGVLALVLWALEMLVSLTMALMYQDDDNNSSDKGLIAWGWQVGIWAATPFFLLDGIAVIGLALWFAGLLGGQALLWAGSTKTGKVVLMLAQIGAAGKVLGPSLTRLVKRCVISMKPIARVFLNRIGTLRKASKERSDGEAEMSIKSGTRNVDEAGSEMEGSAINKAAAIIDGVPGMESADNYDMIDEHSSV
jgi:hypothetical protein